VFTVKPSFVHREMFYFTEASSLVTISVKQTGSIAYNDQTGANRLQLEMLLIDAHRQH